MRFDRYDRIVSYYPAMWPLLVPGYLPILNAMLEVAHALPRRPQRILDLGCGPGAATVAVAAACDPQGQVTLADGSARMLDQARTILARQVDEAVLGDYSTAPILHEAVRHGPYDLILASFALHHLDDVAKRQVLDRLAASLVPGGLLLLGDEVVSDRPAGWDVVERVRARTIHENLRTGRISRAFWEIESSLPPELHLPFVPSRIDDLQSWMARAGLAVSCPVNVFGSALLVGVRPA
ncbi:MAG: class I SAM-dependent methyltransferase [Myxococcota bacterium]